METVGFFTAVSFGVQPKSCTQALLESVDSYFYLGGRKATVIAEQSLPGVHETVLMEEKPTVLTTVCKIISYLTVGFPIILLIAKAILRSMHTFTVFDTAKQLEEGINVSQDTMKTLTKLIPTILEKKNHDDITWYSSRSNLVFSLNSAPGLVFKTHSPGAGAVGANGRLISPKQCVEERYQNMLRAKEVCLASNLDLLVVPSAKKIYVYKYPIIAEQRLDCCSHPGAHESFYRELDGLTPAFKQLTTFVAKTGFSDVEWRNIPIIDANPELTQRRIALVDLEAMESAAIGIFGGGWGRRGLIRCCGTEDQINTVLEEANNHGIFPDRHSHAPDEAKASAIQEIQKYKLLQQFHQDKGLDQDPARLLAVTAAELFDADKEDAIQYDGGNVIQYTLFGVANKIIAQINSAINANTSPSIKDRRFVCVKADSYETLGLHPQSYGHISAEEEQQRWPRHIINALVDKGYLFALEDHNGHGYFVQA